MNKKELLKQIIEAGKVKKSQMQDLNLSDEFIKEYEIDIINDVPDTLEEALSLIQDLNKVIAERNQESQEKRLGIKETTEKYQTLEQQYKELESKYKELESNKLKSSELADEFKNKYQTLEQQLQEKTERLNELDNSLNQFKEKESVRRSELLSKVGDDYRAKLENADIEIIEAFISKPKDSPKVEVTQETSTPLPSFLKNF